MCGLRRAQLSSIEALFHLPESANQCPIHGSVWCSPPARGRAGVRQTHEVPARIANTGVQLRYTHPDRLCPALGKRLPAQIEPIRKDASLAQENRARLHACRLRGGLSNRLRPASDAIGIVAARTFGEACSREECSKTKSWSKAGIFF